MPARGAVVNATQAGIMKSRNRLALTVWLALGASVCLSAPSLAQKGETAALSTKIAGVESLRLVNAERVCDTKFQWLGFGNDTRGRAWNFYGDRKAGTV